MDIELIDENSFLNKTYREKLKKITSQILKFLNLPKSTELCITFIDDIEMRKLNNQYRKIKRTTDVLSFPQDNINGLTLLGDVVISHDTAVRHAKLYEISLHQELKKLLVHSILHLIGYDHKKKSDREAMVKKEKEVMDFIRKL